MRTTRFSAKTARRSGRHLNRTSRSSHRVYYGASKRMEDGEPLRVSKITVAGDRHAKAHRNRTTRRGGTGYRPNTIRYVEASALRRNLRGGLSVFHVAWVSGEGLGAQSAATAEDVHAMGQQ